MTAGPFSIGSAVWPGVAKTLEEMGELGQVLGKLIATGGEPLHYDGSDLRQRMLEEMGDVLGALQFTALYNGVDWVSIRDRAAVKMHTFERWHREQRDDSPPIAPVAMVHLVTYTSDGHDAVEGMDSVHLTPRSAQARLDAIAAACAEAKRRYEAMPAPPDRLEDHGELRAWIEAGGICYAEHLRAIDPTIYHLGTYRIEERAIGQGRHPWSQHGR